MWKFFLLLVMCWLSGLGGSTGLVLLVMFFLGNAYSIRYRGHHGKLTSDESRTLRLKSDVDTHRMRGQWDVVPWWGTSKHVIRKWTWDQIALDTRLQKVMEKASGSLTRASEALSDLIDKALPGSSINPYSGTLAVVDASHAKSHTPKTALALLNKVSGGYKGWTNQAICTLGGTFIISADAYKGEVKSRLKLKSKTEPRMKSGTVAETSRLTWKMGQLFLSPGTPAVMNFLKALFARINPWDKHAVIQYQGDAYYAPTTMFGASATIMKVMNLCEALDLSSEDKEFVGYCVAMHWLDKYLNDSSWFLGGAFTPDRHSLIEALQGMYAHIEDNPTKAAEVLAKMYEEADEARQ
ncbi:hypothetical protein HJC22_20420 [Corallococcus exiguus]|uniref:hypothetical protein n=1 Tax=Corallococcus TaxID=83461 RepID=UPI000ECF38EE|nr:MULTISPECIES: hypothetical protein [Corallococcus]NNC18081.1 hypothetical protein [Corallococcus exiguus]NRD55431.1 hypothetical protein [Corallococcus exiguus]RKH98446.1 hypothetical protein D7Y15_39685 [Corallococcus sp. AB030]RUO93082.1 hypothetical protein D7Y11_11380 [Corallococcus sp. AB018]